MSDAEKLNILQQLADIASLAGINGEVDEEEMHYCSFFETTDSRSQMVYVRPTAKTISEEDVVTFFSPCLTVKKGMLKGISKDRALELLKRNEDQLFARFGIWAGENEDIIVVSVDHILSALDPSEFENHMFYIALVADQYEKDFGQDIF